MTNFLRYLFLLGLSLLITSPFLTIGWFTICAWISLSVITTILYDCFLVSQQNNLKLIQALCNKIDNIDAQCTRLSTIMGEIRDNENPKKKMNSDKFKKKM